MSDFSAFKVTRPHDVIYAVLALGKGVILMTERDSEKPVIQDALIRKVMQGLKEKLVYYHLHYEKDFVDVCKEFLLYTTKTGGSLDIICRPWIPEDTEDITTSAKPSWLLTTTHAPFRIQSNGSYVRTNADTLVGRPNQGKRNYNASSTTQVLGFGFGEGRKRLSLFVEGFIIDAVHQIEACAKNGKIPKEWLATGCWYDQSANPPERFWRTLVASRGPGGSNYPRFYPRACRSLKSQVYGGDISTMELLRQEQSTIVTKFVRRVQEVIWMRRLFTTLRSSLGLAPQESRKGDLICILYGCSVPVILRRHAANPLDVHYEFIGECYVHDLMDGEAFTIQRRGETDGKHEDPVRRKFEIR